MAIGMLGTYGGFTPAPPSTLPTGPLPGETPEQYRYRKYQEQRYLEQQAEGRAYSDWQQAEARAYSDYQNADARAYGDYLNADSRAYGEARQRQSNAERNAYQAMSNNVRISEQQANMISSAARDRVMLADRYAIANARGRQPIGGITDRAKRTLGGY